MSPYVSLVPVGNVGSMLLCAKLLETVTAVHPEEVALALCDDAIPVILISTVCMQTIHIRCMQYLSR